MRSIAESVSLAPESREIRVFLSSPFRDFNEERRLLAKLLPADWLIHAGIA